MLSHGKKAAEMSLTFWFPGLQANPESPSCPTTTPTASGAFTCWAWRQTHCAMSCSQSLIISNQPPLELMLRAGKDTRKKSITPGCHGRRNPVSLYFSLQ